MKYECNKGFILKDVGVGPLLSFVLSPLTAGTYICLAEVDGFSSITVTASVRMRGPPAIYVKQSSSYKETRTDMQVTCQVDSVTEITKVLQRGGEIEVYGKEGEKVL